MPRFNYMAFSVSAAATLWLLAAAREVLTPLLVAAFLWLLLNAMTRFFGRGLAAVGLGQVWLAKAASSAFLLVLIAVLAQLLARGAAELQEGLPLYQAQLDRLNSSLSMFFGIYGGFDLTKLAGGDDTAGIALTLVGSAADLIGTGVLILVYLAFIHFEVGVAEAKLAALVAAPGDRERIIEIGERVLADLETYIGLKALVGFVQAVPTWLVLRAFEVDAAVFWAVIVFLASFIPTIGTLIGILFPATMALLQFGQLDAFLVVLGALAPIQIFASNWLEPRLLGNSLNLSPLVVLLGIFAGGALWGATGAVIVVPMLAVAMIVFARIPSLRPIAIALSGTGQVDGPANLAGQRRLLL